MVLVLLLWLLVLGSADSTTVDVLVQPGGKALLPVSSADMYGCNLRNNLNKLVCSVWLAAGNGNCERNITNTFNLNRFCQFQLDYFQPSGNLFNFRVSRIIKKNFLLHFGKFPFLIN